LSEAQSSDVTVNLTYTNGSATSPLNFSAPTTVIIPAGEFSANVPITIINDDDFNNSRTFEVELGSISVTGVDLGLAGDIGSFKKIVSIINDDCPTQYGFWIGNLSIEDVGYGSTPGTGAPTASGDCDVLVVVNNLPGVPSSTNNTYSLIFTPTNPEGSQGTVVVQETVSRTGLSGGTLNAVYSASGTYDTVSGEIILDYELNAKSVSSGAIVGQYYTGTNVLRLQ
jgi:hypothetical protein